MLANCHSKFTQHRCCYVDWLWVDVSCFVQLLVLIFSVNAVKLSALAYIHLCIKQKQNETPNNPAAPFMQ